MMLGLFEDMEDLLSTNEDFLLGKWLRDARSCGDNKKVEIGKCFASCELNVKILGI
jgi:Alpha-N-acetylglucosaminidase (NAGLU) C-terminal domain